MATTEQTATIDVIHIERRCRAEQSNLARIVPGNLRGEQVRRQRIQDVSRELSALPALDRATFTAAILADLEARAAAIDEARAAEQVAVRALLDAEHDATTRQFELEFPAAFGLQLAGRAKALNAARVALSKARQALQGATSATMNLRYSAAAFYGDGLAERPERWQKTAERLFSEYEQRRRFDTYQEKLAEFQAEFMN